MSITSCFIAGERFHMFCLFVVVLVVDGVWMALMSADMQWAYFVPLSGDGGQGKRLGCNKDYSYCLF